MVNLLPWCSRPIKQHIKNELISWQVDLVRVNLVILWELISWHQVISVHLTRDWHLVIGRNQLLSWWSAWFHSLCPSIWLLIRPNFVHLLWMNKHKHMCVSIMYIIYEDDCTTYWEGSGNFHCKIKKKHEIYFTMENHYSENISVSFTAQVASYFARDGLFFDTSRSLKLMANAWQLFAQCSMNRLSSLSQYVPMALFGSLLHIHSPTAEW